VNDRPEEKSGQQPKSIKEAGQEFFVRLLRHFENDRPDVREMDVEEDR